jgi:hypothetical protein
MAKIYTWGTSSYGALGNGSTTVQTTPTQVGTDDDWVFIAETNAYAKHNLAIKADGTLWGWGRNHYYQLGLNDTTNRTTPTQIGTDTDWVYAVCGFAHSFAIKSNGTLWATGYNGTSCLGLGDTTTRQVFTQVGSGTNWEECSPGGWDFTFARTTDGKIYATGANGSGYALGLGDTTNRATFTQIGSATNWTRVVAAASGGYAINSSGEMYGWGYNNDGRLGLGADYASKSTPTRIGTDSDWEWVDAFGINTVVVATKKNGEVYRFGSWAALYYGGYANTPERIGTSGSHSRVSVAATPEPGNSFAVVSISTDNVMRAFGTGDGYILGTNSETSEPDFVTVGSGYISAYLGHSSGIALEYEILPINQSCEDSISSTDTTSDSISILLGDSATAADAIVNDVVQWFYETISASDATAVQSTTGITVTNTVSANELIAALFQNLVAETASGGELWYLDIASILADVSLATGTASGSVVAYAALAEVIVALEYADKGLLETIGESAAASSEVANRVAAVHRVLETAAASESTTNYLIALREVSDTITGIDAVSLMQVLNQTVSDGAEAFISLSIGGESYTGWVLNTANNAFSEYQGLNFNSLAKIGDRYFGASEDGIFELVGSTDAGENIATYIQTGLMDFGTSFNKSVQYAYIAADSEGRVALGVSVSEKSAVAQYWYEITTDNEAINNLKIQIGKGLRGRYWKFDIASDALESFDAVTLLPVTLRRRV